MSTTPLSAARRVVKAISRAMPALPGDIIVLCYHRIGGGSESEIDLPVDQFNQQMHYLARHHEIVSLTEACRRLVAGDKRPAVAITFDDGTDDFTETVVPLLLDRELPATLYLTTGPAVSGRWPNGVESIDWGRLREAVDSGIIAVGNHTHTHRLMKSLDLGAAANELDQASDLIQQNLQREPEHFAYPKAVPPSPEIEPLIRERFVSAALAGSRPNRAGRTNLHRLHRTPIQASDGIDGFRAKVAGGGWLEDGVRRTIHRVTYRHAER